MCGCRQIWQLVLSEADGFVHVLVLRWHSNWKLIALELVTLVRPLTVKTDLLLLVSQLKA